MGCQTPGHGEPGAGSLPPRSRSVGEASGSSSLMPHTSWHRNQSGPHFQMTSALLRDSFNALKDVLNLLLCPTKTTSGPSRHEVL